MCSASLHTPSCPCVLVVALVLLLLLPPRLPLATACFMW
jgi:hypothetical protein